jgi:antitoxin ParD1/3/4
VSAARIVVEPLAKQDIRQQHTRRFRHLNLQCTIGIKGEFRLGNLTVVSNGDSLMSTIPVQLPDELREYIDMKVERGEFASASDYIVALVNSARKKKSEIEAALLEGLDSGPAEEWTSDEWAEIKKRVVHRHPAG